MTAVLVAALGGLACGVLISAWRIRSVVAGGARRALRVIIAGGGGSGEERQR